MWMIKGAAALVKSVVGIAQNSSFLSDHFFSRSPLFARANSIATNTPSC
jgi:hypothetical protein